MVYRCVVSGILAACPYLSAAVPLDSGIGSVSEILALSRFAGAGLGDETMPARNEESLPEFALEYDLKKTFGKSPEWLRGIQVSLSQGWFDADGLTQFAQVVDESGQFQQLHIFYHKPVRRPLSVFGFYVTGGLTLTNYAFESRLPDDLTALAIGPRFGAGYGFNRGPFMVDVGLFMEYGAVIADDFEFFGRTFDGQLEDYWLGGLSVAAYYNFNEGEGFEVGLSSELAHRRVRIGHEQEILGSHTDLLRGMAYTIGLVAGYRF